MIPERQISDRDVGDRIGGNAVDRIGRACQLRLVDLAHTHGIGSLMNTATAYVSQLEHPPGPLAPIC
jgi:hypothetical protein